MSTPNLLKLDLLGTSYTMNYNIHNIPVLTKSASHSEFIITEQS